MAWIKRNLVVVISAGVALLLIAGGVWYLLGAMDKNKAMDDEIGTLTNEVNRLSGAPVSPTPSNIAQAQIELKRVQGFIDEAKKMFPSSIAPQTPLNNQTFAALLHNSVADLIKDALATGIRVETNYYFSFATQWPSVSFPPASLHPLGERLAEVQQLSSLLFKAKINRLEAIRRARVMDEVPGPNSAGDYLPEMPHMNSEAGMMMWPYEITFQAFSPELAAVLEGMARMPEAYVVRSVVVEPAEPLPVKAPGPNNPQPGTPPRRGGQNPAAAPTTPGLETLLNERLLRVVLRVEVIKPAGPQR